ncbi:protein phosphatase 2C, putative [Eimeria acervulina]|uniref:Protein phosphatase 2C, putative n=1 Tax=Eimeria acervulina TaxID=5801 RepID=U6GQ19_EIMAC|nr:protein phosphatase 2C, putative [Eimeria acervulina]CDI82290.1 protein phosphatase 2C, putative [Eimeria acervulina]
METGDVSPPSFPWEKMEEGAESSLKHAAELERLGWSHVDGGEWIAHTESGWLCNPSEKVYFHAERNILLPAQPQAAAAEGTVGSETFPVEHQQHVEGPQGGDNSGGEEGEEVGDDIQSDDDSDFMLDLEDDLDAATAQKKLCRLRRGASTQEHLELLPPGLQDRAAQARRRGGEPPAALATAAAAGAAA